MSSFFRAVAIDYDGTLTEGGRPSGDVLAAVEEVRRGGLKAVLVTGRILAELRHEFPDVAEHFDIVVAENGAVLHRDGVSRALTAPVPVALDEALVQRGIPFRRGQVLLACDGEHDQAVVEGLRDLSLDCQLSRNRDQLMVLPPGVTKAGGVTEALAQLGLSRHSAVAVGDAENDQALLASCEIGVAVDNAVPSLKAMADVVLAERDGAGVAGLLRGPILRDELQVEPRRWQVDLGRTADGEPVTIPGSRVNVLITGSSGGGKSFAAGFLAERLIALGYTVCIFDPEGDHVALGRLHGVVVLGGREALPSPDHLARLIQQGLGSAVIDLSFSGSEPHGYARQALAALDKLRATAGVPHWLIVDEAHGPLGGASGPGPGLEPLGKGFCLVTYRPGELSAGTEGTFDVVLAFPGENGIDPAVRLFLAGAAGVAEDALEREFAGVGLGQGVLLRPGPGARPRVFTLAPRGIAHVRHWHKYVGVRLPASRRFYFRDAHGPTGAVSANLAEFHHEIRRCAPAVLRHHAGGGEFARWIRDVIQDSTLAQAVRTVEREMQGADEPGLEAWRAELLDAIERRYLA